ncbi:hypothetical protein BBK36DRAFT_1117758 [Trichoderma citrinoviride]|uniref:Uncharacterized protein n=1 Tax=Trichoderma citrinoviride TaxID=58853 RepID=A0A2T4BCF3_9HYPO|nr:hypothetical protein BBK36DRAFT_1117758 [Trichoderma citrinoviride]PTB67012.1 hypothetical protein BBK36DRAFT_1117758 [Trichoderma citrinoviride]
MEAQVPALRRAAEIGTLYDAKEDRFLSASVFPRGLPENHVSTKPTPGTEITVSSCASYGNVFKDLHIDETTAVNILSGTVDLQGASVFLRDFEIGGTVRAAVIHRLSTVQQALVNLGDTFKSTGDLAALRTQDFTHFVIGITWGLQTIVAASCSTPSKARSSEAEEATFNRDLEVLTSSIESASLTPQTPSPRLIPQLELCNEFIIYSDVFEQEGLPMQSVSEICDFIRIVPDHTRQANSGRGWPVAYTLMPVTTLGFIMSLPLELHHSLTSIRPDYLANFIQVYDDIEASAAKLRKYHTYLAGHILHVAKTHVDEVLDSIKHLEDSKSWLTSELFHRLLDVRQSKRDPSILLDLYRHVAFRESTPKQLSALAGQETGKLEFIASAISQGAKYIGYNDLSLEKIQEAFKDAHFYVFHFDSGSMMDDQNWSDNLVLLLELLGQRDERMPVFIMDHDATASNEHPGISRISQYKGNKECRADMLEYRQFLSQKCFARCSDGALDTNERQRPVKRRFVKIPCPRPGCDADHSYEWACPRCFATIEYGFSDDYFYCECGRGLFSSYEFKCNDAKHNSDFVAYDVEQLRKLLDKLDQANYINILILGETGVGKSTFINAFVNYLSYSTLDEAKDADSLASVIPCSFSLQTMNRDNPELGIQEFNVKVGGRDDEVDGSTGNSATQKSAVYPVTIGAKTYRLIDTPGIGDTRGLSYDKENMADILKTISSYDSLHGILVLVKSNNARLTVTFRFCVKELLTHLHRSATKNMAFGFTNTRISNYAPGDTFKPLKALLDGQSDIPITLSTSTTYCFDSESFRYLAAFKQGIPMNNEEEYRRSWDHSSKEAHRLLNYFASTQPHPVSSTLSLNGARKLILELTKPMASISDSIRKNIKLCEDKKLELNDTQLTADKLRKRLRLERIQFKAIKLNMPRTVCKNPDCCDFKDSGLDDGVVVTIYKTHCHAECYLNNVTEDVVADPGLMGCAAFAGRDTCHVCQHRWQEHLHVLYELSESKAQVIDKEIERQLKANADDVTLRQLAIARLDRDIDEFNKELDEIRRASARFCLFLRENAITVINDATLDYLDMLIQDEQGVIEAGRQRGFAVDANIKRLQALKDDRQIHLELVETFKQNMARPTCPEDMLLDEQGVDALVKKLYDLKHFGANLKHIKYVIDSSIEETYRERPYRVRNVGFRKQGGGGRTLRHTSQGGAPQRLNEGNSHQPYALGNRGTVMRVGEDGHRPHSYADATKSRIDHFKSFFKGGSGRLWVM